RMTSEHLLLSCPTRRAFAVRSLMLGNRKLPRHEAPLVPISTPDATAARAYREHCLERIRDDYSQGPKAKSGHAGNRCGRRTVLLRFRVQHARPEGAGMASEDNGRRHVFARLRRGCDVG